MKGIGRGVKISIIIVVVLISFLLGTLIAINFGDQIIQNPEETPEEPSQPEVIEVTWTDISSPLCLYSVLDSYEYHQDVFCFEDNDYDGISKIKGKFSQISHGEIKWYWRTSEIKKGSYFELKRESLGAGIIIRLSELTDAFMIPDPPYIYLLGIVDSTTGYSSVKVANYNKDIWYFFKLIFDAEKGSYTLYIDGNQVMVGTFAATIEPDFVDTILFYTASYREGYNTYIDFVGITS